MHRPSTVPSATFHSPAKINLFLAVVGRRPDGFHDLVSVVVPVSLADTLTVETNDSGGIRLTCDDPALPLDETNLVTKAARAFQEATGWAPGVSFHLQKRIPHGAGLGGGSSNATTTLVALNQLAGGLLAPARLAAIAAHLGSDCPLFLHPVPVVMRGRGEHLEPLETAAAERLRGRRLWVFKPSFGIATPWAFRQLAAIAPAGYLAPDEAEGRLAQWISAPESPVESLLFNSLEAVCFEKYLSLPALLDVLRKRWGLAVGMSGSGSACFAVKPVDASPELGAEVESLVKEAWGPEAFFAEVTIT